MEKLNYKCPFCGYFFKPKRTNQLFCCKEHGWNFRNKLKSHKDLSYVKKQKGVLHNLKVLIGFCLSEPTYVDLIELENEGFKEELAKEFILPKGYKLDDWDRCYEVCGFIVYILEDIVVIYPPGSKFPPQN